MLVSKIINVKAPLTKDEAAEIAELQNRSAGRTKIAPNYPMKK